jgi:alpha-glucosidase (family GH31 glycosyl hydrolase)
MEYSEDGHFENASSLFAIHREARFSGATIDAHLDKLTISTNKLELHYRSDGQSFGPGNLSVRILNEGKEFSKWIPGSKNWQNLGGTISSLDNVDGPVALPEGLLSRDGWHLIDDSGQPVLTDTWIQPRSGTNRIDWYLFGYGSDYGSALKALTTLSGKVPLPRKSTLGAWYSRYWPYSTSDYQNIIEEYKAHDFPLDILVMDMDWHQEGWTGWTWQRSLIPDPEGLLTWIHQQGIFCHAQ